MPSIADHLREPDITIDQHVRHSQIILGQEIAGRNAIYLDMKFWILLREADRHAGTASTAKLLDYLRKGTAKGALFCPISESTFLELMKQADQVSRLATASLIDELSLGIALIEQDLRLETEIAYWMRSISGYTNLPPLEHLVWHKLSHVLGVRHPTKTGFEPTTERALQKSIF